MFYYLDKKELIDNNRLRMFHKSNEPITEKELELLLIYWKHETKNDIEIVVYEADFLPDALSYDESTNQFYIPETPVVLSEAVAEEDHSKDDIFGEYDNNKYVYVDKEECINDYSPNICRVSKHRRLLNYKEIYDGKVLEIICENMSDCPNEIIYVPETESARAMTEYEKVKYNKRKLDENEVILERKKEIVTIEEGQYVNENEEIITIPKLEGEDVIIQEWDKVNHIWINKTTDYDIVKKQYDEYKNMDTPSTIEEMRLQDESLSKEYLSMMIDLRGIMYTLSSQEVSTLSEKLNLPKPSDKLIKFKLQFDKFN